MILSGTYQPSTPFREILYVHDLAYALANRGLHLLLPLGRFMDMRIGLSGKAVGISFYSL